MSVYPNTGCHAVLALLSEGYPPLEGRSPTRYSPVCHSTHPLRDFRVRLACVRHAASVDSEPGSNSQVKLCPPTDRSPAGQLVQPVSLLNWLSDSSPPTLSLALELRRGPFKYGWSRRFEDAAHPLILDGLCLHVLSSFQRTGTPQTPSIVVSGTLQIYRYRHTTVNPKRRAWACRVFLGGTRQFVQFRARTGAS